MREISPAIGISVDDWLKLLPPELRATVEAVRQQKQNGTRPRPSTTLKDNSTVMWKPMRDKLLDFIASLVDENYAGRAEMCMQFALLLNRALIHLNFPSRAVTGWAIYFDSQGNEVYRWEHAWVRIGGEVIDGNVDSIAENPAVPKSMSIKPYWGPLSEMPKDRRLRQAHGVELAPDTDVDDIWWPELQKWIDIEMSRQRG